MASAEKIAELAAPLAAERGLVVIAVELSAGGGRTIVRVILDADDWERSVGLKDCERVSRELSDLLDAYEEDGDGARYMLEVSSPGVDRPLRCLEHFTRVIGSKVRVTLAGEPKRTVLGRLLAVDDDRLKVAGDDGSEEEIAYADVAKANLEYEFEDNSPPKRRKKR